MTWLYHKSKGERLWTVGYYAPYDNGQHVAYAWQPVEDFDEEIKARRLVNYLNGGSILVTNP